MALLGFIYWSGAEGRGAKVSAAAAWHRDVGHAHRRHSLRGAIRSCGRCSKAAGSGCVNVRAWFANYAAPVALSRVVDAAAAIGFFVYCHLRWGRWDLYMLTQEAGWAVHSRLSRGLQTGELPLAGARRWMNPTKCEPDDHDCWCVALRRGRSLRDGPGHAAAHRAGRRASGSISAPLSLIISPSAVWPPSRWRACCVTSSARTR